MIKVHYAINKELNTIGLEFNVLEFDGELTEERVLKALTTKESIIFPKFKMKVTEHEGTKIVRMELVNNYQLERFCNIYHAIKNAGSSNRGLAEESSTGKGLFSEVTVNPVSVPSIKIELRKRKLESLRITTDKDIVDFVVSTLESEYNKPIPDFIYHVEECDVVKIVTLYFNETYDKEDLID